VEKVEAHRQIRRVARPRDRKTLTLNSLRPLQARAQGLQAEKVEAHRQIRRIARRWDHKTLTEVVAVRLAT
jgi:hypothetical protein